MKKTGIVPVLILIVTLALNMVSCSDNETEMGKAAVPTELSVEASGGEGRDMSKEGMTIFIENCQACHGEGGKGDICPDLTDDVWKYGSSERDLYQSIAEGRPGGMPPWQSSLGDEKIRKLTAYIKSLGQNK
jgi:cytochrome c oxidase cbb3-type subunit 3